MFIEVTAILILFFIIAFAVSYRMSSWDRAAHSVAYFAAGLLMLLAVVSALGQPKGIEWETVNRDAEKVQILAAAYEQDRAIYLWLLLKGESVPRYYSLPWSDKAAEQLQKAMREGKQKGKNVELLNPFKKKDQEYEFSFHEIPVQPDPDKIQEQVAPIIIGE